jgi:hypothetical protein
MPKTKIQTKELGCGSSGTELASRHKTLGFNPSIRETKEKKKRKYSIS